MRYHLSLLLQIALFVAGHSTPEVRNMIIVGDSSYALDGYPLAKHYNTSQHPDPKIYPVIEDVLYGTAGVRFEWKSDSIFIREVRTLFHYNQPTKPVDSTNMVPKLFLNQFCSWMNEELLFNYNDSVVMHLVVKNGIVREHKALSYDGRDSLYTQRSIEFGKNLLENPPALPKCTCSVHTHIKKSMYYARLRQRGMSAEEAEDSLIAKFGEE